jgi:putative transposase
LSAENELIAELTLATGSQRQALELTGLSRSTWHYRQNPRSRVAEPIGQEDRAYSSRIGEGDRDAIAGRITAGWAQGHSVDHTFAWTRDAGVMLASRRSWWRVAADIQDQIARQVTPTKRGSKTPREASVLEATGPGQVWSWDITDLCTPWRGCS